MQKTFRTAVQKVVQSEYRSCGIGLHCRVGHNAHQYTTHWLNAGGRLRFNPDDPVRQPRPRRDNLYQRVHHFTQQCPAKRAFVGNLACAWIGLERAYNNALKLLAVLLQAHFRAKPNRRLSAARLLKHAAMRQYLFYAHNFFFEEIKPHSIFY